MTPGKETWFPKVYEPRPDRTILDEESEISLYDYINENFIKTGLGATSDTIKEAALNSYSSSDDFRNERFCASYSFVKRFMDKFGLSFRKPHAEKRTKVDEKYTQLFLKRLSQIDKIYPLSRIVNCDETSWRLAQTPNLIIAEKGAETVKLIKDVNEKLSITALGTITAEGEKLPMWIVTKGTTVRSFKKLGQHPSLIYKHSKSGWVTSKVMDEYLEWLSAKFNGEKCVLILDVYPGHRTEDVIKKARSLKIELLYVPAGGTSIYQPLDRRIFGELKSRARRAMMRIQSCGGSIKNPYDKALDVLVECWDAIPTENVSKAWDFRLQ